MKPILLIVSATIRRDLHRPFRRFRKFRVIHAYMDASYGDLDDKDLDRYTRQYKSSKELERLLTEIKPDLVQGPEPHASRTMLKIAWVVWRWHKRTSRPFFFPMFENLPLYHKFGAVGGSIMSQILKIYAQSAAWIYVLNNGAKKTLKSLNISDKKIIRANWGNWGIDRTEFASAMKPEKYRAKNPTILFVGRISLAKGVDILLNVFEKVKQKIPNAELWLVGPTFLDRDNEYLIERAKAKNGVKLIGPKKQRELPEYFQQAWVSVLLSRTTKKWAEQVGMVALQSLACGTPVVAADSGSIKEYLKFRSTNFEVRRTESSRNSFVVRRSSSNGSILVPEGDANAATEAILTILRDPKLRERMGVEGVEWIEKTFDEANNVPELEKLTLKNLEK